MSHVLLVSNTARNIYHYRRTVWTALLRAGYRVSAAAAADDRVEDLKRKGIAFYAVPLLAHYGRNPAKLFIIYRQFSRLYRRVAPDLVLHFTIQPNTLGTLAAARRRLPTAATITGLGTTWLQSGISRYITVKLYRWCLRFADLVITQNEQDRKDLLAGGVRPAAWRTIEGSGVDTELYTGRTSWVLPRERTFLYLGRMLKDKGIQELFVAWNLAWQRGLRGRLLLVGDRPGDHPRVLPEATWRRGLQLPGVSHHPAVADVRPYLADSHFVVLPSYREGLSLTLLEALATETPILTTRVPGCRELVEGRHTGWAVTPRSAEALADAFLAAHHTEVKEWRRMGENGRRLVIHNHSAEVVAAAYREVVESLVTN